MKAARIPWSDTVASANGHPHASPSWRGRLLRVFVALIVLLPCMYGFCTKFWELVVICRGDMTGAFAIAPIMNYLLASAGFLLLLGWAAANGMFHDIERPKRMMLEQEDWLDSHERRD